MSRRGENIRKRKDGRWEGRYIKGYDSKKQKARYASVYGKTYAETKQKLDEAKYKSSIGSYTGAIFNATCNSLVVAPPTMIGIRKPAFCISWAV